MKKKLKLSEYMRIGIGLTRNDKWCVFHNHCACAIGAAIAGKYNVADSRELPRGVQSHSYDKIFADVPDGVWTEINNRHRFQGSSRLKIVKWLAGQGY